MDTSLVPAHPSWGLRILLSARDTALLDADAWSARIGWRLEQSLVRQETVQPLNTAAASALLTANGLNVDDTTLRSLAAALVDPLDPAESLTAGDPLLLQLYAEDLADRQKRGEAIGKEVLADVKPSYGAYFQDWFHRQKIAWAENENSLDDRRCAARCASARANPA